MSTDIARLDLRLRRRSIIGYAAGMAVYTFVIVAMYPTFKDDTSLDAFTTNGSTVAALFGASGPLTTPSGWLSANIYANFLPLMVLLLTVGYGAHAVAGQDEAGTLGPISALPITRRAIVVQKFGALCIHAVPVSLVTMFLALAGRRFQLPIDPGNLVGITVGVLLLGIVYGALALFVGALTGSRGVALGTASAAAAAGYLVSSLAPVVKALRPWRFSSPFYYAVGDGQLVDGLGLGWVLLLAGVAVVLLGGAVAAFERLDIH